MKKILDYLNLLKFDLFIACTISASGLTPEQPKTKATITNCTAWELSSPANGKSIKVGDTLKISWCIPDSLESSLGNVLVMGSFGNSTKALFTELSDVPLVKTQKVFFWVVSADQVGDFCRVFVRDYLDSDKRSNCASFQVRQ